MWVRRGASEMSSTVGGGRDADRSEPDKCHAGDSVEPDPRWAQYMLWSIPECADVRDDILDRSGRPADRVDGVGVLSAVVAASRERLCELTCGRDDVTWEETRYLIGRPDFDHRLLAAFLSTKGAVGVAINDKFAAFLSVHVPAALLVRVCAGEFHND